MTMKIKGPVTFNDAIELKELNRGDCFTNNLTGGLFMKSAGRCDSQQMPCFRFRDGNIMALEPNTPVNEVEIELNWRYK